MWLSITLTCTTFMMQEETEEDRLTWNITNYCICSHSEYSLSYHFPMFTFFLPVPLPSFLLRSPVRQRQLKVWSLLMLPQCVERETGGSIHLSSLSTRGTEREREKAVNLFSRAIMYLVRSAMINHPQIDGQWKVEIVGETKKQSDAPERERRKKNLSKNDHHSCIISAMDPVYLWLLFFSSFSSSSFSALVSLFMTIWMCDMSSECIKKIICHRQLFCLHFSLLLRGRESMQVASIASDDWPF